MKDNERNSIGWQLIKKLRSNSFDQELFNRTIKEFASDSSDKRIAVAMSLIEIGTDTSETAFDRNYALSQLALLVRICDLRNNMEVQSQLNYIIDEWILDYSQHHNRKGPWGALIALGSINRNLGLQKCDYVIKCYGESETGREMSKIRENIESLNPLDR